MKRVLSLLCVFSIFASCLPGCGEQQITSSNPPVGSAASISLQENLFPAGTAENFTVACKLKFENSLDTMTNGDAKAFLADLDNDSTPELFFIYDNYKSSQVVVFRLYGTSIEELGSFEVSYFYSDLHFELLRVDKRTVLHSESIPPASAANPNVYIYDFYISLADGRLHMESLCRVETKEGGEPVAYYSDALEGEQISKEAYESKRDGILNGLSSVGSITIPGNEMIHTFSSGDQFENYIASLLDGWNSSSTILASSGGFTADTKPCLPDLDDYQKLRDKYLANIFYAGILNASWADAEQIDPDLFVDYFTYMHLDEWKEKIPESYAQEDMYGDLLVPRQELEDEILQYFQTSIEHLRKAQCYRPDSETYQIGGVGNVTDCSVSGATYDGNFLVISYDTVRDGEPAFSGVLTVAPSPNGTFGFVSNEVVREQTGND